MLFESDGPFTRYNKFIIEPRYFKNIYEYFNRFYKIDNFQEIVFNNFKKILVERQLFEQENRILKSVSKQNTE